jgi:hypothetical protein
MSSSATREESGGRGSWQEFSRFCDSIPGESRDKMCSLLPLELEECALSILLLGFRSKVGIVVSSYCGYSGQAQKLEQWMLPSSRWCGNTLELRLAPEPANLCEKPSVT